MIYQLATAGDVDTIKDNKGEGNNVSEAHSKTTGKWLTSYYPNPQAGTRLFCFPYAGGGPGIYRSWAHNLPANVEVLAIQIPGRVPRLSEPPFTRMEPLVEALAEALTPRLDRPFAFFGHSMGAIVSFELARRLRRSGAPQPFHLFVSGRRAPHIPDTKEPTYDLPEPQFIEVLRRLNGTPREALESAELMAVMIPVLRADFAVCQTYKCEPEPRLACALTAFGGSEDEETADGKLEAWREQTTGSFSSFVFQGDHFFLHSAERQTLNVIYRELYGYARRST